MCEGGVCESEPSVVIEAIEEREDGRSEEEQGTEEMTVTKEAGEVELKEKAGKVEVCLVEDDIIGKKAEQEVTVWEEDISEEGVHWFSSVLGDYERKREEVRRREVEYVRTQGLLRDFPHLKVGGLLPCLLYTSPSPRD